MRTGASYPTTRLPFVRSASIKSASALFLCVFFCFPALASASVTLGEPNLNALTTGLVGHWPLNGPATSWLTDTTQDISGNGNTGTLVDMSTSTSPVAGKIGQALSFAFSSADYVQTANTMNFNQYTFSFWLKVFGNGGQNPRIMTPTDTHWILWDRDQSAGIGFYFTSAVDPNPPTLNTWVYYAVVYDRANSFATIYRNGVAVASGTVVRSAPTGTWIMGHNESTGNPSDQLDGAIDDMRVYDRLLSAQEVALLYAVGQVTVADNNTVTLQTGLVGHWPLNGPATSWLTDTTQDTSGNGNTGTLVGMSTTSSPVAGKIGQALQFNGSNQCIISYPGPSVQAQNKITLAGWIYPKSFANYNALMYTSGNNNGWWLQTLPPGDTGAGYVRFGAGGSYVNSASVIPLNQWSFLTGTFDGTNYKLYINGVLNNTASAAATISDSGIIKVIGDNSYNCAGGQEVNGYLDDLRIYNRALSAQEVQQLYALGQVNIGHSNTVTVSSGLVGHWPLNGPATSWLTDTTQDTSGNGNTGTLVGMSTTSSPVAGKIGQALQFGPSTSYVNIPNSSSIGITGDMTITAWVNTSDVTDTFQEIAGKTLSNEPDPYDYYLINYGVTLGLRFYRGNGSTNCEVDSSGQIAPGKWQFVAVTMSGTSVTHYLNGAPNGSAGCSTSIMNGSGSLEIGNRADGATQMHGTIDDVRIYNRALSAQEVEQLYLLGK